MGVKSGGNCNKIRLESGRCRQDIIPEAAARGRLTILLCPPLSLRSGDGIERVLVGGGIKNVGVIPEHFLGAVAVVHIEVDEAARLWP
jgi:hypothetical protein